MEINIDNWTTEFTNKINAEYGEKVLFVGLQGSYNRGEATDSSDIDMVVILDKVEFQDLEKYKSIVSSMPNSEKACGFISGKIEIQNWSKSDMFQFVYDTRPLFGKIADLISLPTEDDIKKAVKIGAENLYHSACHSFIYEKDYKSVLPLLFKMTFYIIQASYYLKSGKYLSTKNDLIKNLNNEDKEILEININKDKIFDYSDDKIKELYAKIINWSSKKLSNV